MQNFWMCFKYFYEDCFHEPYYFHYYEVDGVYDGKELEEYMYDSEREEEFFSYVAEVKEIIKKNVIRIRDNYIKYLNNSQGLESELNALLDTIDNECYSNCNSNNNFIFLTDNYLCFNNYEFVVDELMWGSLGSDAEDVETIVIIERNFKKFYFVRIAAKLCAPVCSTTINCYSVKDSNIKKTKVNLKRAVEISEYTEDGIKKVLKLLNCPK